MESLNSVSILGHLGYIFLIVAFVLRNIIYLRLVTLLSICFAIVYYSFCLDKPLLINVGWEIAFSLVNIFMLLAIAYERYFVRFTPEEQKIYNRSFANFSPLQFKKLIKYGGYLSFEKGDYLIRENSRVEKLLFICAGATEIIRGNKVMAHQRCW